MAEALIKGVKGHAISASDVRKSRLNYLKKEYRVKTFSSNKELVRQADIIILAVKPQSIKGVLKEVSGRTHGSAPTQGKLFISIAAGITIKSIEKFLGGKTAVIRVMPNTPALINAGISVLAKGRYAKTNHLNKARKIFLSVGKVIIMKENKINAVTAISGSGPAYFFYLVECLIKTGVKLGLKKKDARALAIETALGSVKLIKASKLSAQELRKRVTSKGGTTEAAFKVFKKNKLDSIIEAAVKSAAKKSKELSK